MRKSITALLLLALMLATIFCACGKTPDQLEVDNAVTLETLDWSIAIEGGSVSTYTLADAGAHELSKVITSMLVSIDDPNISYTQKSFRVDGIKLSEFLADVGKPDATQVTFYGKDIDGNDVEYTLTPEEISEDEIILGWIVNKEQVLTDTDTYVGLFGSTTSSFPSNAAVSKIVVD